MTNQELVKIIVEAEGDPCLVCKHQLYAPGAEVAECTRCKASESTESDYTEFIKGEWDES